MLSSKRNLNNNNNKNTPIPLESEGSSDEDEDNREMEGKTVTAAGNEVHEKINFPSHFIPHTFFLVNSIYFTCVS